MAINRPIESLFNKNNRFFNMFFILKGGMKAKKIINPFGCVEPFRGCFFIKIQAKF
jgi:hypothetical protein